MVGSSGSCAGVWSTWFYELGKALFCLCSVWDLCHGVTGHALKQGLSSMPYAQTGKLQPPCPFVKLAPPANPAIEKSLFYGSGPVLEFFTQYCSVMVVQQSVIPGQSN